MASVVGTSGQADLRSPRRAQALAVAGGVAAAIGVFALAPSLLGWALLAALERVTPLAARIWTAAALTLLVVSFLPVIGVQAAGGSKVVLALTHAAVGAVLIPVFWRTAAARRADTGGRL